ncbi:MAG: class I SAM-dependent methyltransferase [Blastocatellia bacterium]
MWNTESIETGTAPALASGMEQAESTETLLTRALAQRTELIDERHETVWRLFSGFQEGCADLVVEVYGRTAVIHDYAESPAQSAVAPHAIAFLREQLPWVDAILLKQRHATAPPQRNGTLITGTSTAKRIREAGVWYCVDLALNRDTGFYPDTRNVRQWARENLAGKTVLNTFAYTGSLGVAARAGGAARVAHLDLRRQFLNIARASYTLNGFPIEKQDFLSGDFWPLTSRLNRAGARFDCLFLDPPLFSVTQYGTVDLPRNYDRLINKVRPLINNGGCLVAINNAVFVSGAEYMAMLTALCADGYMNVETLIPVPPDCAGFAATKSGAGISDPAPFNHSTKIAVLRVRRKS